MESILYVSEIFKDNDTYLNQLTDYTNNQYHTHDFFEIFYVVDGSAQQKLNNTWQEIACGDLFILRPSDYHCFKSNGNDFYHRDFFIRSEALKDFCNTFGSRLYTSITSTTAPPVLTLTIDKLNELEELFNKTNASIDLEEKETFYKFILSNILSTFFSEQNNKKTSTASWINKLISSLSLPYNLNMPLSEIMAEIPYNRSYICRAFKSKTGKTPTEYFNDQKLAYAYLQIISSTKSITQIANSIGIYHRSLFYRLFNKKYGISPSELKKRSQTQHT